MTAKEKAKELFKKYSKGKDEHGWALCEFNSCAKICTLIAVDEVIQQLIPIEKAPNNKFAFQYWQEVKQEIEKL
jgi:hypothetical protein